MKQAVNIAKVHNMVWEFRAVYGELWPTPDRVDALRFAFCESAEAMDAWLRMQPLFNRNRAKDLSVLDELADTAIMLLTALGCDILPTKYDEAAWTVEREPVDLDVICGTVTLAFRCTRKGFAWTFLERVIKEVVGDIALYPGMELETRIARRLDRIRLRVVGQVFAPLPAELKEVVTGYVAGLEG